ncbi:MAG: AtpZ/AtpI family protein [Candidatus Falkowbacteria bacterium]
MKINYSGSILRLLFNITSWIVGPVLVGVFLGKWLDQKFNTDPWLFLASVGFCFLVSMFGLVRKALQEFKKIEEEYKKDEKKQ